MLVQNLLRVALCVSKKSVLPDTKATPLGGYGVSAEDSDEEMVPMSAAPVQKCQIKQNVCFDDVNEGINLVDVHPESNKVWKEVTKKTLRPDLIYVLHGQRTQGSMSFDEDECFSTTK